ncbi:MAG: rod-binding protein [Nitrospirae bacterium]|nr:rod-binding protein [Nitrospirota bacterium]
MSSVSLEGIRDEPGRASALKGAVLDSPKGAPLARAARKFEAMVVEGMVREMWKTIPVSQEESRSPGLSIAQEMYQKELSKELVGAGGFGLARQIVEDTRKGEGLPDMPSPVPVRPTVLSVTV